LLPIASPFPLDPGELFHPSADRAGFLATLRGAGVIELRRRGEERRRTMQIGSEFAKSLQVVQIVVIVAVGSPYRPLTIIGPQI
jgi:hypothetical protein